MLELYFIRHGETIWNTEKKFQGTSNSNLTKLGIEQAKLLGKFFENISFSKIYSSPLERAISTTKYIVGEDKNIIPIDEFKEICMGEMEGKTLSYFEETFPKEYKDFWDSPEIYDPSNFKGENFYNLLERVEKGLAKIINENNDGKILIVTHGITLKAIFNIISKNDISDLATQEVPENTSFTIVKYDNDSFTITDFSKTEHLNTNITID